MKKILYLFLCTALLSSCTGLDKCQRAERKMARLIKKCPDLIKSDTTETVDTTTIFETDTIFVEKKIIDSLLKILVDTVTIVDKQVIVKRIKEECKEKIVTNTEVKTITKYKTINKSYPVEIKPNTLQLLGYVWWWLLIAFLLGLILNGIRK